MKYSYSRILTRIELALGLRSTTESVYLENTTWAANSVPSEFFAWAMQGWFNANISKSSGLRNNLPNYQQDYYGSIFEQDNEWSPTCDGKP